MDLKRLVIGTVVGGITMSVVGYLIWNVVFDYWGAGFVAAGGSRESPLFLAEQLQNIPAALLVTLAVEKSGSSAIVSGIKCGAIVGFVIWSTVGLAYYANTTIFDLTETILDPLLASVQFGIAGGATATVLAKR